MSQSDTVSDVPVSVTPTETESVIDTDAASQSDRTEVLVPETVSTNVNDSSGNTSISTENSVSSDNLETEVSQVDRLDYQLVQPRAVQVDKSLLTIVSSPLPVNQESSFGNLGNSVKPKLVKSSKVRDLFDLAGVLLFLFLLISGLKSNSEWGMQKSFDDNFSNLKIDKIYFQSLTGNTSDCSVYVGHEPTRGYYGILRSFDKSDILTFEVKSNDKSQYTLSIAHKSVKFKLKLI